MQRVFFGCVVVALCVSQLGAQIPESDGSLFIGDSDTADMFLVDWIRTGGNFEFESTGPESGNVHLQTQTTEEGFGRANMRWAPREWTEWVAEFDVKVSGSSGDGIVLFETFSPNFAVPLDIALTVELNDWISDYPGGPVWDFSVWDADGKHGIQSRFDPNEWHHFVIYHRSDPNTELWVDNSFVGLYAPRGPLSPTDPNSLLAEMQIGDVTGNNMWGNIRWDNFRIGAPVFTWTGTEIFSDDFSSGDLSKWKRVDAECWYDPCQGNPAGSIQVDTQTNEEGFARANLAQYYPRADSDWVSEFDVKLNGSAGDGFLLYAPYAAGFTPIDIEIVVATHDYVYNHYGTGHDAWDLHVYDAAGYSGLTLRLDAQQWHHFRVYRTDVTGVVDLYIDGDLKGSYQARNSGEILAEMQIGDVTGGGMWGNASWDNFSIRIAPPVGTCGDILHPYPEGDLNKDCHVDEADLQILGENWLN